MALSNLSYTLRTDGSAQRTSSGDLAVGASNFGLIAAAAFADDPRLAGVNETEVASIVQQRRVSPPIPIIDARNALAQYIYSADTAVPYNIEKLLGTRTQTTTQGRQTVTKVYVITAVFPAILARVALFYVSGPAGTLTPVIRATSTRDDGSDAIKKFLVRSYDASYNLGSTDQLLSLNYKISQKQPYIDVRNDKTFVEYEDATANDIIIIACSDTSPNAGSINITVDPGISIQNLLSHTDAKYYATLTNPYTSEEFTVGSAVRIDRVTSDGVYKATLTDVTGAVQAVRLTPAFELTTITSYNPVTMPEDNLAFFKVMVERNDRMQPIYPNWLLALQESLASSGALGLYGNWPMNVIEYDDETGEPKLWNELQIWAIDRNQITSANIPFGEAYVYPTWQEVISEMTLLDKQL